MLQTLSCRMDVAAAYGADAAIFMNNIVFWTLKNKAENRNYHEGRYWTYGTVSGFAKLYPLWSEPQLKRIISKCHEAGILLIGDFNDDRRDRTRWYSPSDEILKCYGDGVEEFCIVRNRKMQSTESSNAQYEIGKCNKVQVATQVDNTPHTPQGGRGRQKKRATKEEEAEQAKLFERFWKAYPRHTAKADAKKAWDKLKPDLPLCRTMAAALEQQKCLENWQRDNGRYIPMAATWLNQRRWEDEIPAAAVPGEAEDRDGI